MRSSLRFNFKILRLDRAGKPLYLQLIEAIEASIRSGELSIGQRLPPERGLAIHLGVSRTTVTSAYRELEARGILRGFVGRGTLVIASPMDSENSMLPWAQRSSSVTKQAGRLSYNQDDSDIVPFEIGWQDQSLYPLEGLNAVLRNLARVASREFYQPPRPGGDPLLTRAVSQWLETRGIKADPKSILITAGAQQGLNVLAKAFIEPGDAVLTEAPTFLGALMAFRWAGAEIIGVPVDDDGIRSDPLEETIIRQRPKFLFLMPNFQNPTGTVLSLERRKVILDIASRYRVPIIESDLYGEIYFDHKPPLPLKAMDVSGSVIYQGSFSKIVAPSLRVGWLVVPDGALPALLAAKAFEDLHTPTLTQQLVARFLTSHYLEPHLASMRTECHRRRDRLVTLLRRHIPELQFRVPQGGYYLWARLPPPLTTEDLIPCTIAYKVAVRAGTFHMPERGGENFIRLSFASVDVSDIAKGVQRLAAAIEEARTRVQNTASQGRVTRIRVV